jgi:16S rRNA C1402 N4-methylase RsmH
LYGKARQQRSNIREYAHIDERELADVVYKFGEDRRSRRIARA